MLQPRVFTSTPPEMGGKQSRDSASQSELHFIAKAQCFIATFKSKVPTNARAYILADSAR